MERNGENLPNTTQLSWIEESIKEWKRFKFSNLSKFVQNYFLSVYKYKIEIERNGENLNNTRSHPSANMRIKDAPICYSV